MVRSSYKSFKVCPAFKTTPLPLISLKRLSISSKGNARYTMVPISPLGDYNHLVYEVFVPQLAATGRNFHIQQPGVKVEDNRLLINKVMQGGDVLYCFDDGGWQEYKDSVIVPENVKIIKAKICYLGKESNTTWLWR